MSAQPTTPQPDLFTAPPEDVSTRWLEDMLKGAGCWLTAADIKLSTHGKVGDRELRKLASMSSSILSGQKGYCCLENATAEEVNHAANWLESQAKCMSERACRLRREAHRRLG